MSNISPPPLSVVQRAETVYKAMSEIHCLHAQRQIRNALAIRNGSNTLEILDLSLNSDVQV